MPLLTAEDPLPGRPRRILVAGASGAGKTTVAATVGELLGIRHIEIDGLFHGPNWTPRLSFVEDIRRCAAEHTWVIEWQYSQARDLLADRAQLMVWLDLSRWRVMQQVVRRTLRRRLHRQVLWNGNVEPPLRTILHDPEHIIRWAWSSHPRSRRQVQALLEQRPDLDVVHLPDRRAVRRWVGGPLEAAAAGRANS